MMQNQAQAAQPEAIKTVRIQTSAYGVSRGMIYGTTRTTMNLIWYGDFTATAIPSQSGSK
jgi:3D (Asp-Asp-Asp) domain-containing protein